MSFLIDWIPRLWNIQAAWGTTWLVGCIAIVCLGITGAGYAAVKLEGEWDLIPPFVMLPLVLAAFWPLAVIALPFIAVAVGLFVGGMAIAHNAEGESDEESVKKRPDWAGY